MIASPLKDSPNGVLLKVCPSPYASDAHASRPIVLRFWLVDICYFALEPSIYYGVKVTVPDYPCFKLNWCSGEDSSWENLSSLTAIHNPFRDWGKCPGRISQSIWSPLNGGIRRSLINFCRIFWLIVPNLDLLRLFCLDYRKPSWRWGRCEGGCS